MTLRVFILLLVLIWSYVLFRYYFLFLGRPSLDPSKNSSFFKKHLIQLCFEKSICHQSLRLSLRCKSLSLIEHFLHSFLWIIASRHNQSSSVWLSLVFCSSQHLLLVIYPYFCFLYFYFLLYQNFTNRPFSLIPSTLCAASTCPVSTTTVPACPTVTKPATGIIFCPLQTPCGPHPDCILLKTVTEGCAGKCCPEKTPTVTAKPSCPTCQTGCATSFTTTTEGC